MKFCSTLAITAIAIMMILSCTKDKNSFQGFYECYCEEHTLNLVGDTVSYKTINTQLQIEHLSGEKYLMYPRFSNQPNSTYFSVLREFITFNREISGKLRSKNEPDNIDFEGTFDRKKKSISFRLSKTEYSSMNYNCLCHKSND